MALSSGYLKKYFKGIIVKTLSDVETMPKKSNQHEFNATVKMKEIFGSDDRRFETDFLYLDDEQSITAKNYLTWYDARRNHPTRTEYRLYYATTPVSEMAQSGDSLFICVKQDGTILCVVADGEATITSQLYWLFDIEQGSTGRFRQNSDLETDSDQLEFLARTILEQIGISYEEKDDDGLREVLINRFGSAFPKTDVFSAYARSLVKDSDPLHAPDEALLRWFDMEERMFFLLEEHIVSKRIADGFTNNGDIDVKEVISFSLSVQNRRKSRVGYSLENHLCALFDANGLAYSHTKVTENRSKPDFLFPDIKCYHDGAFPVCNLTMLGAKSTCKDRWRQVLAEADRIERKHLLTLEAAISTFQTNEMQDKHLQLVVPSALHKTYTNEQQQWLYTVQDFIGEVREKQKNTIYSSMLKF